MQPVNSNNNVKSYNLYSVSSYEHHKKILPSCTASQFPQVDFITILSHVDRKFRNRKIKLSITYLMGYIKNL